MALATSSGGDQSTHGLPGPQGFGGRNRISDCSNSLPIQGVSAVPGVTALTLMPSLTWSAAIARVSAATAPLLAEYSARWGTPTDATTEHVLTTEAAVTGAGAVARPWSPWRCR